MEAGGRKRKVRVNLGHHQHYRDQPPNSGTVPPIPGRLATMIWGENRANVGLNEVSCHIQRIYVAILRQKSASVLGSTSISDASLFKPRQILLMPFYNNNNDNDNDDNNDDDNNNNSNNNNIINDLIIIVVIIIEVLQFHYYSIILVILKRNNKIIETNQDTAKRRGWQAVVFQANVDVTR